MNLTSSIVILTFWSSLYAGSHESKQEPPAPSHKTICTSITVENPDNRVKTAYVDSANKRLLLFFASGAILTQAIATSGLRQLRYADDGIETPEPDDTVPLFGQIFPLSFETCTALFFITKNCHLNTIIDNKIFSLGALQADKPPVINDISLKPNPYRIIDIKAIVPFGKNCLLLCTTGKFHIALSFNESDGEITMNRAWIRMHHVLSALTYIHQRKLFIGAHTGERTLPLNTFSTNEPISSLRWWLDNFWSISKEVPALSAGNQGDKIAAATSEDKGSIIRILYCFEYGNKINWSELFRATLIAGEVWRMIFSKDDRWLIVYYTVRFTPQAALFDLASGEWNQTLQHDDFKSVHPVFVDIRDNQLIVVGADGTIAKRALVDALPPHEIDM